MKNHGNMQTLHFLQASPMQKGRGISRWEIGITKQWIASIYIVYRIPLPLSGWLAIPKKNYGSTAHKRWQGGRLTKGGGTSATPFVHHARGGKRQLLHQLDAEAALKRHFVSLVMRTFFNKKKTEGPDPGIKYAWGGLQLINKGISGGNHL